MADVTIELLKTQLRRLRLPTALSGILYMRGAWRKRVRRCPRPARPGLRPS